MSGGGDGNPVKKYKNPVVNRHVIHTTWASDREHFLIMASWCKATFGKSHGASATWMVVHKNYGVTNRYRRGVAFLNHRAAMLARLTWE